MTTAKPRGAVWSNRAFTSLLLAALFLVLTVSGCVRYFAPRCRDANWGGWDVLGLGKDEWVTLHMAAAAAFIIIAALHVVLNWRPLLSYFRVSQAGGRRYVREFLAAIIIAAAIVMLSLAMLPPASLLSDLAEQRQERFATELQPPAPWRHAEDTPLAQFATKLDWPLEAVLKSLNKGGRLAHGEDTLRDVARWRGTTPATLYQQLRDDLGEPAGRGRGEGHGIGRGGGRGAGQGGGRGAGRGGGRGRLPDN